jgi:hypothetical protein
MRRSYLFLLALALFQSCAGPAPPAEGIAAALEEIRPEETRARMGPLAEGDLLGEKFAR